MASGAKVQLIDTTKKEGGKDGKDSEEIGAAEGGDGSDQEKDDTENKNAAATAKIKAGEMCCFRVFDNAKGVDDKTKALIEKLPRFNAREAIERSETGGADRINAAG